MSMSLGESVKCYTSFGWIDVLFSFRIKGETESVESLECSEMEPITFEG